MKQAILVTAYKNFSHLEEIITFFNSPEFEFYIHIDSRSEISASERKSLLSFYNVKLVSTKYQVKWGGLNHLKSILFLAENALKNQENFYFHLISGHDFPIKEKSRFIEFFERNRDRSFMEYFDIPQPAWGENGGMDRLQYFQFFDIFNWKEPDQNKIIIQLIKVQKKLGIKRPLSSKMPKLYGGSTWWSLSREALEYVLNYTSKNRFFLRRFKYTLCSEEFYFQTILMNSPLVNKIIRANLRHIDWVARNGNRPAILDKSDLEILLNSDAFFARKFEVGISDKLMKNLKHSLNTLV